MALPTRDEALEVVLNGVSYPLVAPPQLPEGQAYLPVTYNNLATFQRKNVFGDYTKDSNDLLSTWVISDLSGGVGKGRISAADAGKFRDGTLQTRWPGQITVPWATVEITGANTNGAYPLGDLNASGTYYFYAAFGIKLQKFDETTDTFAASLGDLLGAPTNRGTAFRGTAGTTALFIPSGASGWAKVDTAGTFTSSAARTFISFLVYADQLIGLENNGDLYSSVDGTAWTSLGISVDDSEVAKKLLMGRDASGAPMPIVVTDQGFWSIDMNGPFIYRLEAVMPRHPNGGTCGATWRGNHYVGHGASLFQLTAAGQVESALSIDSTAGISGDYLYAMVDVCDEFNGLYVLVKGNPVTTTSYASIYVYTGFGFQPVYKSSSRVTTTKTTALAVSNAQGGYRLWWGEGGSLKTQQLPPDFANPESVVTSSIVPFETTRTGGFYLDTGRFDADMTQYEKIASAFLARIKYVSGPAFYSDNIPTLQYRINDEDAWTTADNPVATSVGTNSFVFAWPFGGLIAGSTIYYQGVAFRNIEFRLTYSATTVINAIPLWVINSLAFTHLRVPQSIRSWSFQIDATTPYKTVAPIEMMSNLEALLTTNEFFRMLHLGAEYRVRIAKMDAREASGEDDRRIITVNVVEAPSDGAQSGVYGA